MGFVLQLTTCPQTASRASVILTWWKVTPFRERGLGLIVHIKSTTTVSTTRIEKATKNDLVKK